MTRVPTVLWRASVRSALAQPWQTLLAVLGVAIGVAVVIAIDLASGSAQLSFEAANRTVLGRTTHRITGDGRGIDESVYPKLVARYPQAAFAPSVQGQIRLGHSSGESVVLLGLDALVDGQFRSFRESSTQALRPGDLFEMLSTPGAIQMTPVLAERLGFTAGETLEAWVRGRRENVRLVGFIGAASDHERASLEGVVVTDIASAQEILGRLGRLDHIDIVTSDAQAAEIAVALEGLSPTSTLAPAGARAKAAREMTAAFNLNLRMLGLLSFCVGVLLVYNTMTFAVLRRRSLFATLRAMGVTAAEIGALVVAEALALTVIGFGLGACAGIALGHFLLGFVAQTVNDLYFEVSNPSIVISWTVLLWAGAGSLVAALAAVIGPLRSAVSIVPALAQRNAIERQAARSARVGLGIASALLLLSGLFVLIPGRAVELGFAASLSLVAAAVAFAPMVSALVANVGVVLARALGMTRVAIALRGISGATSRVGVAVAAMTVALATTLSIAIMIDSFRGSVETWLSGTLRADMYVRHTGGPPMTLDTVRRFRSTPGVESVSVGHRTTVRGASGGEYAAFVLDPSAGSERAFQFTTSIVEDAWRQFATTDAVFVSEPFAYRHQLRVGDELPLIGAAGSKSYKVLGVYRDYSSERGVVMIHWNRFARDWESAPVSTVGVYLEAPNKANAVRAALVASPTDIELSVRSNTEIKRTSLAIFDRTFVVTSVLRAIALIVASLAIVNALLAMELERGGEFGLLRALGLTRQGLFSMVQIHAGGVGLIAACIALPLGVVLAVVLINVVNHRSFGWTMEISIALRPFIETLALALLSALVAGVYPALRIARKLPAAALGRGE
ncbi:MAG: FtsX-like permease family protein [Gammaproteobacteria bacterium]|nr:FtsX-like permease family protein [Gammaproteobacteria bacterium]